MVKYLLKIKAELENLTNLQPLGGCDDPKFTYYFKLKCGNCGEVTSKETCVSLEEIVTIPNSRGKTHLVQKCKYCMREGTVTMIPGKGRPLTEESRSFTPLMLFDCRGFEPMDFVFRDNWKAESLQGTKFEDIDLSEGVYTDYDEKGAFPVTISELSSTFEVTK